MLSVAELQTAIASTDFGARAVNYVRDPRFQAREIDYKRRLAVGLSTVIEAIPHGDRAWLTKLRSAIQSTDDNIINWRVRGPFLDWCSDDPAVAATAIAALCSGSRTPGESLERFAAVLSGGGLTQPGQHLAIGSVLLMATGPDDHPPVRARVISKTMAALQLSNDCPSTVGGQYTSFIDILDGLIAYSQQGPRPLRSRLEAQGAVWCATGGWPSDPAVDEGDWVAGRDKSADADIEAAQSELVGLAETERTAVVKARKGQGKYRTDLLNLWIGCAVTGCASEAMLRASHLKPWRQSTNAERLNPYNGLLLTPNLDQALDGCLISFTDDGALLISSTLSREDTEALGLHPTMKLRFVRHEHKEFLAYHRSLFDHRERPLRGTDGRNESANGDE